MDALRHEKGLTPHADVFAPADDSVRPARPAVTELETARRVLLLTSGLGSGHMRAAKAIEEAWRAADPQVTVNTLDFWSLMDPGVADLMQRSYLHLVSEHPDLYDRVYSLDQRLWRSLLDGGGVPEALQQVLRLFSHDAYPLRHGGNRADRWLFLSLLGALKARAWGWPGGVLRSGLLRFAYQRLSRRMGAQIRAFNPNVIVVTEMWPAVLLSSLKPRHTVAAPIVGVLTDYGVHDLWIQPGIDHYCVATPDMRVTLCAAGVEEARIGVTGIPLMPGFRKPPSREEATRALGLDQARAAVLLLGGGLGLGLEQAAQQLVTHGTDAQWLVVAGRNEPALERLGTLASTSGSRLHLYGWTEHMELLMRAADVVVGKPGGLTVAEVMACGRPLLATHCLRGQEGFNLRFLESHGVGQLVPGQDLAKLVAVLMEDRRRLALMQARAWDLGHRDSAQRVVEVALMLEGRARASARPQPSAASPSDRMRLITRSTLHKVDDLYHRRHGLQPVGEVLYAGRTRYHGPAREFADGTRLAPGDYIGTLHFNNARFPRIEGDTATRAALSFARLMLESMRSLADRAGRDAMFSDLAVYHAVSWLPPHGQRFGFITEPFPDGPRRRMIAAYFRLLVWAFAPAEQTRASATPNPTIYWLTRKELRGRFGQVRDDV